MRWNRRAEYYTHITHAAVACAAGLVCGFCFAVRIISCSCTCALCGGQQQQRLASRQCIVHCTCPLLIAAFGRKLEIMPCKTPRAGPFTHQGAVVGHCAFGYYMLLLT